MNNEDGGTCSFLFNIPRFAEMTVLSVILG